ncbi:hypothetical protein EYC84_010189 [Monilinia fructicola]|uniref:Uncharacterized protein n=1 Tax=Monilinia fructicola TaxID=38448 RepID=A0A5M9JH39_MONFR|nr:hypothetical protein EYC84_010189 [Monilinia fructicola]
MPWFQLLLSEPYQHPSLDKRHILSIAGPYHHLLLKSIPGRAIPIELLLFPGLLQNTRFQPEGSQEEKIRRTRRAIRGDRRQDFFTHFLPHAFGSVHVLVFFLAQGVHLEMLILGLQAPRLARMARDLFNIYYLQLSF